MFIMTEATIFVAMIIGTAMLIGIVLFCMAWSVFKQVIAHNRQAYEPRKYVMENDLLTSSIRALCMSMILVLYLLFITLMVLFGTITVKLYLGSLILSVAIGIVLFFVMKGFLHKISDSLNKIRIRF